MMKALAAIAIAALFRSRLGRRADLSVAADHHDRAVRGGRRDRLLARFLGERLQGPFLVRRSSSRTSPAPAPASASSRAMRAPATATHAGDGHFDHQHAEAGFTRCSSTSSPILRRSAAGSRPADR